MEKLTENIDCIVCPSVDKLENCFFITRQACIRFATNLRYIGLSERPCVSR